MILPSGIACCTVLVCAVGITDLAQYSVGMCSWQYWPGSVQCWYVQLALLAWLSAQWWTFSGTLILRTVCCSVYDTQYSNRLLHSGNTVKCTSYNTMRHKYQLLRVSALDLVYFKMLMFCWWQWKRSVPELACWRQSVPGLPCWGRSVPELACWRQSVPGLPCWGRSVPGLACWGRSVPGLACWGR